MRRGKRVQVWLLACILCAPFTGCWLTGKGDATSQFAQANYELSGLIGEALRVIHESLKARILKPDAAIAAATVIGKFNTMHRNFLLRVADKLQTDGDGNEVIVFGLSDQLAFEGLLRTLADAARDTVSDPAIVTLDSSTRGAVMAALTALPTAIAVLLRLLNKLPKSRIGAPPLRLQVTAPAAVSFRLLLPRLDALDKLISEVR